MDNYINKLINKRNKYFNKIYKYKILIIKNDNNTLKYFFYNNLINIYNNKIDEINDNINYLKLFPYI